MVSTDPVLNTKLYTGGWRVASPTMHYASDNLLYVQPCWEDIRRSQAVIWRTRRRLRNEFRRL